MLHEKVYHDEPELDPEEVTSNSSENESALWSDRGKRRKGRLLPPPSFRDGPYFLNCLFLPSGRKNGGADCADGALQMSVTGAVTAAVAFL